MSNKGKEKKPVGKVRKTVLTVTAVVLIIMLIVAAVIGIKFRSHIKAAIIWLTTSEEDIQNNIDKAKEQQTEVLANIGFNVSEELDDALSSGLITAEEHTQILLGNLSLEDVLRENSKHDEPPVQSQPGEETDLSDPDNPANDEHKTDGKTDDSSPGKQEDKPLVPDDDSGSRKDEPYRPQPAVPQRDEQTKHEKPYEPPLEPSAGQGTETSDVDKRIAELVTKMYMLKSEYSGAVNGVVSGMKAEYSQLPAEQRTRSAKQSIAAKYISQINAMETQCDAQVDSIVSELRKLLKENGRDTALADAILSSYASEKENTKAYYLSTYGD